MRIRRRPVQRSSTEMAQEMPQAMPAFRRIDLLM
jgi:hypothetical protein